MSVIDSIYDVDLRIKQTFFRRKNSINFRHTLNYTVSTESNEREKTNLFKQTHEIDRE